MKRSIITTLAVLLTCGAFESMIAQETAGARGGVRFRLGKAINRGIIAKPRARQDFLQPVNRVHYATNVYQHEGVASAKHDVISSHGLFVHIALDEANPTLKAGHALAE